MTTTTATTTETVDASTHPNAVEYGAIEMMKGKSPALAAKTTAKKLSGGANIFLGSPVLPVSIDPDKLEAALLNRLADRVLKALPQYNDAFKHYALEAMAVKFRQGPRTVGKVKELVIASLGHDPFQLNVEDALKTLNQGVAR